MAAPAVRSAFPIVGVGASAGGLEAFTQFLQALPPDTGMAFVLVQHLAPAHKSSLAEILARSTSMSVREASDDSDVLPNHVYVIPPDKQLALEGEHLALRPREPQGQQHPIDEFFRSLAGNRNHLAIGVVLSGTATDGTLGIEEIKAQGGITFAQDDSATYDGMPRSAIASGCVDFVLSPRGIAEEIARIAAHPLAALPPGGDCEVDEAQEAPGKTEFLPILATLRATTGIDFAGYKASTLSRRIRRRMVMFEHQELADYERMVRDSRQEAEALTQDILINVTGFFRDPAVFAALETQVIPKLLAQRSRHDPLRAWVLGCSTGEEAYSLAMLLAEAAEGSGSQPTVQVFATDVNAKAIEQARAGVYSKERVQGVSRERLERFFEEADGKLRVTKALRETCLFSRHDALSDPPFSRMDLVSCRNLLIYLDVPVQRQILSAVHYAIKPTGYVVLGASETVGRYADFFTTADGKHKIYTRNAAGGRPPQVPSPSRPAIEAGQRRADRPPPRAAPPPAESQARARSREAERLLLALAPPAVLVDPAFQILEFRGDTEPYLAPAEGRASLGLLKMARPALLPALRNLLGRATQERVPVHAKGLRLGSGGRVRVVDLEVLPVGDREEEAPCLLVLFKDGSHDPAGEPSERRRAATRGEPSEAAVAGLKHELARSRDEARALAEQHDLAIEELQAANEEAESANEELQSINEELSTTKEEIQSSNEELTTVNEELHNRNLELGRINSDLENLFNSVHIAIVIVSRDLRIRRFSPTAATLLGITPSDVGRPVTDIRMKLGALPLDRLLAESIDTLDTNELDLRMEDGCWYSLRINPYLTVEGTVDGAVLAFVDVTDRTRVNEILREGNARFERLIDASPVGIYLVDSDLRIQIVSRSARPVFGDVADLIGSDFVTVMHVLWPPEVADDIVARFRRTLETGESYAVRHFSSERHDRAAHEDYEWEIHRISLPEGRYGVVCYFVDISARLSAERSLRESEVRYRRLFEAATDGVLILDAESGRITEANFCIASMLGCPPEDLRGKALWEIGLFDDEAGCRAALQELKELGALREAELSLTTRAGQRLLVEVVSSMHREGERSVIQCHIRDITARKLMEAELARRNELIAELDRAKDEFIATLAHELRSPLSAIRGWIHVLRLPETGDEDRRKGLEVIDRSSRTQSQLIADLFDIERIASGKLTLELARLDLQDVVGPAVDAVTPIATEKGVLIERDIEPAAAFVSGDSMRLHQVLANLLSNALKFTPKGGRILVSLRRSGSLAEIGVSDTGQGIAPEAMAHLFQRYRQGDSTTSRRHGGLGLGLAICKQLVELHGGSITARSAGTGEGTTFAIVIPLLDRPDPPRRAVSRATRGVQPAMLAGTVVLIVDDDPDAREPVRRVLESAGAEAVAVSSAAEALAALSQRRPDLILSDIGMPGQDGYELLRSVRKLPVARGGAIPAIALTSYSTVEDRGRALAAGFQAHLTKPVEPDELIAAVAELVAPAARGSQSAS